jgi:hypothetical protein
MVEEVPLSGSGSNYNQAIYLERGWNLVSWYVELPDWTGWSGRLMDDVFREPPPQQGQPYGAYFWLNPILDPQNPEIGDRAGKYNSDPIAEDMYPEGTTPASWTWSMSQAYHIYRDSTDAGSFAYFWEYENQPHSTRLGFTFNPSNAWDEYVMPGGNPNYWYFLAYPLRMSQVIDEDGNGHSENSTILALENNQGNAMRVLKDDAGHQFVPGYPHRSDLISLEPGKGYFIGFMTSGNVVCPGFVEDQEPASVPGGGSKSGNANAPQTSSLPAAHFTFKSRTHWWYPVVVDTADLGEILPAAGDEIGVFDGDLCVGSAAYPDSFPVTLAAWKDDIASLATVDGYQDGHEMTFKWFDQSANQEITFVPPPGTQAMDDDPVAPTHSGFGAGFYALRSFTDGVQAINQLPQEFKIGQNFPNPFNAATVIPLELPQRSQIRIELYNVRGQALGLIYQGVQNSGWPKIRYDASRLPSGVYFYRVQAEGLERGGKIQSIGKMLVLK